MNSAERIYATSISEGEMPSRLAVDLARRVEDDIAALGLTPGGTLGSLRTLAERYGAGRSVVREAVGLLERRGLGRMRPGPGGGFILAKPQPESIGAALADYFLATGLTVKQLGDAREAVDGMTAHRAGASAAEPVLPLLGHCLDRLTVHLQRTEGSGSDGGLPSSTLQGTLSASIARRLAAEIARTGGAGTRLGSEPALCERFNVSRLTLRQAIRLLQDSGLVECRRGRGNGLVVRDRRAAGGIRLVLAYLIGEKMDPMTAGTLLFELNCYVPALAVSRADADQRRQLEASLARVESQDSFERYDLLALVHCVSRLADSPIIDLFSRCLAAYEARFRPSLVVLLPTSAQAAYFQLIRRLLARMPIGGDPRTLAWGKRESAALMLEMSRSRPI
ncbi:MAG: GntR family transcriptional regulator [Pseudomonadota bacterium]